jgi:hypothetical protein
MRVYSMAFAILVSGYAGSTNAQPTYNGIPLPPPRFQMPSGHSLYGGADTQNHGSRIPSYTAPMIVIRPPPPTYPNRP